MNRIVNQSLQWQMDQEAKQENIIFYLRKHRNVDREMCEMLNKGIVLELGSL